MDALEAIGAHDAARIAARANGVFPDAAPPRDRSEREALLESLGPDQEALLDGLDAEFYRYPDDLTELLYDHVVRNATDIPGAAEAGIHA